MTNKPVIISDLGGVIYSFSESFDPEEYEKQFVNALKWYSENNTEYKNALTEYNDGNLNLALDIEREAVIKGISNGSKIGGILRIYVNVEAAKKLFNNAKKFKVVIVSTSRKETSLAIIKEAFKQIKEGQKSIDKIVSGFDIFDMSVYGSKKNGNAWKNILKNYQNVIAIVEDSEKNLNIALQAASELGQNPKKSLSMVEF